MKKVLIDTAGGREVLPQACNDHFSIDQNVLHCEGHIVPVS